MYRTSYLTVSLGILGFFTAWLPSTAMACRAPLPSPNTVVSGAEVIVRASAVKYSTSPRSNLRQLNEPDDTEIEFKVMETLKGKDLGSTIRLYGYLIDQDDFNDRPVPYDFVRPRGRGGSCSAYEYKQGAEFLLFLKKLDGKYTVRWIALGPTNEQLRSADDPWIVRVKNQLKSLAKTTVALPVVAVHARPRLIP